jgi:hypothetical protein
MTSSAARPAPPQIVMVIESAAQGWGLVMQSGVRVSCAVGIPLKTLLREEFGLAPEQIGGIDVMLLDGKPVDEPEAAFVPHGARLALAAGLPGIAGLAMKSGSEVRGLRSGITFTQGKAEAPTTAGSGEVELALFSLALAMLAGHFLARGVILRAEQLVRYAGRNRNDACLFCGQRLSVAEALDELARLPEDTPVLFAARLRS